MGLDYRVRCCPDGLMTDRRRHVSVLDCTIRDGGICSGWHFPPGLVRRTVAGLAAAGVDIMEIGYQTAAGVFDEDEVGPWRFCREAELREVADAKGDMRLSCMVDVGRIGASDLRPADDSVIDMIRVACYAAQIDEAIELSEHALSLGYDVFCNVMAVTRCTPQAVDAFLERLRGSGVPNVAVVDSFGAMYPHQVRYLIRKYKNWLRPDQRVGVHLHNNQQTAFANAIASIDEGADVVDASIFGMGRGAGNVPLELLLMYLDAPRFDVEPVLELADAFTALRAELRWGYEVPYAITGWLNHHPRSAIERVRAASAESLELWGSLTRDRPIPRHHRARTEVP
ncbi:MAG TPA: nucleoid-structuring protein H-NS [Deltaproteobacteria bacterium]|nr:nucleoid-structuring protein H-NS [Deltaproteobacteria bacterium]